MEIKFKKLKNCISYINQKQIKILKYIYYNFLEPKYDYYYNPRITYLNIYDQYKKYGKFIFYQYTYNGDYSKYYYMILGYDMYEGISHTDNVCFEDFGFEALLKQYFKTEIRNEIRKEKIKQIENYGK